MSMLRYLLQILEPILSFQNLCVIKTIIISNLKHNLIQLSTEKT
jgi:hypothetical protein